MRWNARWTLKNQEKYEINPHDLASSISNSEENSQLFRALQLGSDYKSLFLFRLEGEEIKILELKTNQPRKIFLNGSLSLTSGRELEKTFSRHYLHYWSSERVAAAVLMSDKQNNWLRETIFNDGRSIPSESHSKPSLTLKFLIRIVAWTTFGQSLPDQLNACTIDGLLKHIPVLIQRIIENLCSNGYEVNAACS